MEMIAIDYEYRKSEEPHPELVAVAVMDSTGEKRSWWLGNGIPDDFKEYVESRKHSHVFVGFSISSAECRCFSACGWNPIEFQWIDLRSEYRQMQCGNYSRLYGKYVAKDGMVAVTRPPLRDRSGKKVDTEDINHQKVEANLVNCVLSYCNVNLGRQHKSDMIKLILRGGDYTPEEKRDILDYCESDIQYLLQVLTEMEKEWVKLTRRGSEDYYRSALLRGEWSARLGVITDTGIPIDVERLSRLGDAVEPIHRALAEDVNIVFPAYRWEESKMKFVECQKTFDASIERMGMADQWPRTAPSARSPEGVLKRDKETLEGYEGVEEFDRYRRAKNILHHMSYLKKNKKPKKNGDENKGIYEKIGSDNRLRPFYGPYGTQTTRNAPPASSFILAMASMFRCAVVPPPGYAITGSDFGSQEFLLAGLISGDKNMIAAYESGDPYTWMAIKAEAVPPDATKHTHPEERDMFKIVTLGLQFGIGTKKLAIGLSKRLKREMTTGDAEILVGIHHSLFATYWEWADSVLVDYQSDEYLELPDGWFLFGDLENPRSVVNLKVQGGGGVVMRRAVKYAQEAGLQVIATLHDALYILHPIGDGSDGVLTRVMKQAFYDCYAGNIKVDTKTIPHGMFWIEEKGKHYFRLLADYFLTSEEQEWYWLSQGYSDKELAKMEKAK